MASQYSFCYPPSINPLNYSAMAGTGLLSKCLDFGEVNSIPANVRGKLEQFLSATDSEFDDIKTKYERLQVSSGMSAKFVGGQRKF